MVSKYLTAEYAPAKLLTFYLKPFLNYFLKADKIQFPL